MKSPFPRFAESLRDIILHWPAFSHGNRDALIKYLRNLQKNSPYLSARVVEMMEGVLSMNKWQIRDVMVPKNDIVGLLIDDDYHAIVQKVCAAKQHSRYPVFDDNGERVCGVLHAKDLLRYVGTPDKFNIRAVMRPAWLQPQSKTLETMLDAFLRDRRHMVIVVDEYESPTGIVTIEDVLERIVGEIRDEFDSDEADAPHHKSDECMIRGALSVEEFNATFGGELPEDKADTIAGWLAATVGKMPPTGHIHIEHGFLFEVVEADERRIHYLRVRKQPGGGN